MSKKKAAATPKKESKKEESNVAKIGDNSGDNVVKQAITDILELHKKKKELSAAEKGIKADLKANGIAITAFNHVLRVSKMEEETAANFLQDTRILFEALDMQGAFDFTDGEEKPDAADPLEAAKAEANA